ncbi:MAG: tetratricopeptide repeat protein [Betaproteobacteria bacterium]|nr:tetratricopeptide repeat protein [Betaproteobacteria bacterium]
MRTVFSCCRFLFDALIVTAALSLYFLVVGVMPVPAHAQPFPRTNAQEQNKGDKDTPFLNTRDIPAQTLFNQAVSFERESPKDAMAKYDDVMQRYGRATTPGSRQFAARALLNKGSILSKQGNDKDAVSTYERIERNFGNEKTPAIREVLASAIISKAEATYKQGDAQKAIDIYDKFNKQFSNDDNDFIKRLVDITGWRVAEIRVNNKMALSSRP